MAHPTQEQIDRETAAEAPATRQCPTLSGDLRSLITHRIRSELCMKRQREHYHKCHRCLYRGQSADLVIPESPRLGAVAETGFPTQLVELPKRSRAAKNGNPTE